MRISGGKAKGIPLRVTKIPELRPATESNRERLFSSLGQWILDKRVLDLFSGSGAYGLEALSRGAIEAYFVEWNRRIISDLESNLESVCKSAGLDRVVGKLENREVTEFIGKKIKSFDLIFLDPPYSNFSKIGKKIFFLLHSNHFVHPDSLLVLESPKEEDSSFENWKQIKTLGKGKKGAPIFRLFKPLY